MKLRLTDPSMPFEVIVTLDDGSKVEFGRFRTAAEAEAVGAGVMQVANDAVSTVLHELHVWVDACDAEETLHRPDENIHKQSIKQGWDRVRRELQRRIEALHAPAPGKAGGQ